MRDKWLTVYVDLFAGPGKSKIRDSSEIIKGSPLAALAVRYAFNQYIFVETAPDALSALEKTSSTLQENDGDFYKRNRLQHVSRGRDITYSA
jgi:three-Cys-motif partner protein